MIQVQEINRKVCVARVKTKEEFAAHAGLRERWGGAGEDLKMGEDVPAPLPHADSPSAEKWVDLSLAGTTFERFHFWDFRGSTLHYWL